MFSVSWCLPLIATAIFQTAIITLGAKSQKVQARKSALISPPVYVTCIWRCNLFEGVLARHTSGSGWDIDGTPVDFPLPAPLCHLHLSNHLHLHTPHQAIQFCYFSIHNNLSFHQAQWQKTHSTRQHCKSKGKEKTFGVKFEITIF